jgi:hypothetical protein
MQNTSYYRGPRPRAACRIKDGVLKTPYLFSCHLVHFPKDTVCFAQVSVLGTMWGAQAVLGQIASFFRWGCGRKGHCEHVGALVSVIYNASTRPVVMDSMRRGPHKQPIHVRYPNAANIGAADGMPVWMMDAVDGSSSLARTNGLAVVWRLRLTPEG